MLYKLVGVAVKEKLTRIVRCCCVLYIMLLSHSAQGDASLSYLFYGLDFSFIACWVLSSPEF